CYTLLFIKKLRNILVFMKRMIFLILNFLTIYKSFLIYIYV
ncbi:hypothetical protein AAJ76_7300019181, partial [Vairimorpha ceranae]